jgi:hypothetical protein
MPLEDELHYVMLELMTIIYINLFYLPYTDTHPVTFRCENVTLYPSQEKDKLMLDTSLSMCPGAEYLTQKHLL